VGGVGDSVTVTRDVGATPEVVWALVSDVTRMAEFSPENVGCEWIGPRHEPVVGARFRGTNRNGKRQWKTTCKVVLSEPARAFVFEVRGGGLRVARWEYRFDSTEDGGCRVAETWIDQRGRLVTWIGGYASGIHERKDHNRSGMVTTLDRLAAAAEGTTT
jgi:hypothetical protein